MSEAIREAIAPLLIAQRKGDALTGSRKGLRDLDKAIRSLQSQCFHRLVPAERDGFRYRCVDCEKYLKILSGVKMPEGWKP